MAPNLIESSKSELNMEMKKEESKSEIFFEGYFYDVSGWIKNHPGGDIINIYTIKNGDKKNNPGFFDATLPILQFHNRSLKKVHAILKSLPKREASAEEIDQYCPKEYEKLTKEFKELQREFEDEGFFNPSLSHSLYRGAELLVFLVVGLTLLHLQFESTYVSFFVQLIATVTLSMFASRCGWWMHEGGHNSITGKPKIDKIIQSLSYGIGGGMSGKWWTDNHNLHHAMPQNVHHDTDIQTLPLIAFNKKLLKEKYLGNNWTRFLLKYQAIFFCFDTFLLGLFWKVYLHPRYAWKMGAYSDLICMVIHYILFFTSPAGLGWYLVGTGLTSWYLLINLSLNHTHLPVTDKPIHWVEYSLLSTVDIDPSPLCTWWMSFLNFQIEHHLFPTMPQFRHAQTRERVIAFAKRNGLPYQSIPYFEAVRRMFMNLYDVSKEIQD